MSFQPIVPQSGIAGWRFLERTMETQRAAFDKSADVAKDVAYFKENIAKVNSAADLMADRRLLKIALGAFGLQDDVDKKAFIRKILEEGTEEKTALANKLLTPAYRELSRTFGFGDTLGARTTELGFAEQITKAYADNTAPGAKPVSKEDIAYFQEKIGEVKTAAGLVADPKLLKVALGAFGLAKDADNPGFVYDVLSGGQKAEIALANNPRAEEYREFARTFGFNDTRSARTDEIGFAERIASAYRDKAFEVRVGEVNNDMRLVMNFQNEIPALANSEKSSWYSILSSKPMLEFFRVGFGLPASMVSIDIDRQAEILEQKAEAMFGGGGLDVFKDPDNVEKMTMRFLAMSQIENGGAASTSPASGALMLLQSANPNPSAGLFNLLSS